MHPGETSGQSRSKSLIGREQELGALLDMVSESAASGSARAAIVLGGAGLGKSRLSRELAVRAAQRGVAAWLGRADPGGRSAPFGVLADMLHRLAQIGKREPMELRREKLRERLGRHVDPEALWEMAAVLGEAAGIPFFDAPAASSQRPGGPGASTLLADLAHRAWEDLLAAELEHSPILLILDDAERADLPSMRLFDAALRNLAGRPLSVIALGEPQLTKAFPGLFEEHRPLEIALGELTEVASRELLSALTHDRLAPATLHELAARSGGNPFVLEGLALAANAGAPAMPGTVVANATARFNAAGAETRQVLRAASVLGEVVAAADLNALLSGAMEADTIEGAVDQACALGLAERRAGGGEIAFRAAAVRDVAYASFSDVDRARVHLLAAQRLASADRDPAVLAWHYERGGAPKQAAEPYRMAAVRALAANDFEAAVARGRQAEASGAEGATLGEVARVLADAHTWRGETADAEREARRAMDLLPPGSVPWVQATTTYAVAAARLGNPDALQAAARDVEALASARPFSATDPMLRVALVVAMGRLAVALVHAGEARDADGMLGRMHALRVAGALDELPFALGHTYRAHAIRAHVRGELLPAFLAFDQAAASFERARALRDACNDHANAGFMKMELGQNDEAERRLSHALATATRLGLPTVTANAQLNLALLLGRRGAAIAAAAMAETALATYEKQASARAITVALVYLTRILLASGAPRAAEARARRAAVVGEDVPPYRAYALAALSATERALGRTGEALEAAEASMAALREAGTEEGEAFIRLAHVEALMAAGRTEAARAALFEADTLLAVRADAISDLAHRKTFLHEIPEHARTVQMAEVLGVGQSSRAKTMFPGRI